MASAMTRTPTIIDPGRRHLIEAIREAEMVADDGSQRRY